MPQLVDRREADRRRARLTALVEALPEAEVTGEQHLSFAVRGKRFGWCLDDHHGDGRLALDAKAAPGVNAALVEAAPDRFHLPAYVASKGWLGLWLDLPAVDWDEVDDLVRDAYRLTAPKRLLAQLDDAAR